jgi:hypothetical protein
MVTTMHLSPSLLPRLRSTALTTSGKGEGQHASAVLRGIDRSDGCLCMSRPREAAFVIRDPLCRFPGLFQERFGDGARRLAHRSVSRRRPRPSRRPSLRRRVVRVRPLEVSRPAPHGS